MSLLNDALRKKEQEGRAPGPSLPFAPQPRPHRKNLLIAVLGLVLLGLGGLFLFESFFNQPTPAARRPTPPQTTAPLTPATPATVATAPPPAEPLAATPEPQPIKPKRKAKPASNAPPQPISPPVSLPAAAVVAASAPPSQQTEIPAVPAPAAAVAAIPAPAAPPALSEQLPAELQPFFAKAQALQQDGRLAEAATLYRQLLNQQPRHQGSLYALTECLLNLERFEEALPLATRLSQELPDEGRAWLDLAIAEIGLGQTARALSHLDRVTATGSYPFEVQLNRGAAFSRNTEYEQALAAYHGAERIRPGDPALLFNLALTLDKAGQNSEALAAYERYLKSEDPQRPQRRTQIEQRIAALRRHQALENLAGRER